VRRAHDHAGKLPIVPRATARLTAYQRAPSTGPPAEAAKSGRAANEQSKKARLPQAVGLNSDRRIALRRHLATANICNVAFAAPGDLFIYAKELVLWAKRLMSCARSERPRRSAAKKGAFLETI
jgi:hypothetical protein